MLYRKHSARAILLRDRVREKSHYCIGVNIQKCVEDGFLEERFIDRMTRYLEETHGMKGK